MRLFHVRILVTILYDGGRAIAGILMLSALVQVAQSLVPDDAARSATAINMLVLATLIMIFCRMIRRFVI